MSKNIEYIFRFLFGFASLAAYIIGFYYFVQLANILLPKFLNPAETHLFQLSCFWFAAKIIFSILAKVKISHA